MVYYSYVTQLFIDYIQGDSLHDGLTDKFRISCSNAVEKPR